MPKRCWNISSLHWAAVGKEVSGGRARADCSSTCFCLQYVRDFDASVCRPFGTRAWMASQNMKGVKPHFCLSHDAIDISHTVILPTNKPSILATWNLPNNLYTFLVFLAPLPRRHRSKKLVIIKPMYYWASSPIAWNHGLLQCFLVRSMPLAFPSLAIQQ